MSCGGGSETGRAKGEEGEHHLTYLNGGLFSSFSEHLGFLKSCPKVSRASTIASSSDILQRCSSSPLVLARFTTQGNFHNFEKKIELFIYFLKRWVLLTFTNAVVFPEFNFNFALPGNIV